MNKTLLAVTFFAGLLAQMCMVIFLIATLGLVWPKIWAALFALLLAALSSLGSWAGEKLREGYRKEQEDQVIECIKEAIVDEVFRRLKR